MKFNDFQEIIKDKDIKDETVQKQIFEQINSDINATVKIKEDKFDKTKADLEAKLAESNLKAQQSQSKIEELSKQSLADQSINSELKDKLYIVGKSEVKLTDGNIRDIRTLAATRVNENTTREQAIDSVIAEFFAKKAPEAPKKQKSVASPQAQQVVPQPVKQGINLKEMFGFGKSKKNQNLYKR